MKVKQTFKDFIQTKSLQAPINQAKVPVLVQVLVLVLKNSIFVMIQQMQKNILNLRQS